MESELEQEAEIPGLIMQIPEEVRGFIFNKLQQKEALLLRLVCRQWRNDIDTFFDFKIRLNEESPYFSWMLQLRIKECKIIQLVKPIEGEIFSHPPLVRNIDTFTIFPRTALEKSNFFETISPENFHSLLTSCGEHLQKLSTHTTAPLLSHQFPQNVYYNFENLRKLKIFIDFWPASEFKDLVISNDNVFTQLFETSQTPNLDAISIKIHLNMKDPFLYQRFIESVLICICKRRVRSMQVLKVFICPYSGEGGIGPAWSTLSLSSSEFDKIDPKNVQNLKEINIDSCLCVQWWCRLLLYQNKLEYLEIKGQNSEFQVSGSLLKQIICNNWMTLVSIDIVHLGIESVHDEDGERNGTLDMSCFQYCHNLQKLSLRSSRSRSRRREMTPDLINVFYLPLFIRELHLENFLILTDDLLSFSTCSRGLSMLTLRCCGTLGAFGINGSVLEGLLSFNSLRLMKGFEFNVSDEEEASKLYSILPNERGLPDEKLSRSFITLCRDSESDQWKNEY